MIFVCIALDPFETQNRASSLLPDEVTFMHDTLSKLRNCKGRNCTLRKTPMTLTTVQTPLPMPSVLNDVHKNSKRKHGKQLQTIDYNK